MRAQRLVRAAGRVPRVGVSEPSFAIERTRRPVLDDNPFLSYDPNLCITCQRCVAACNRLACNHSLTSARPACAPR